MVGGGALSARPAEAWPQDAGAETGGERHAQRARIDAALQGAISPAPKGRLAMLAELFSLSALETDIIAVLWAAAMDPELPAQLAKGLSSPQITVPVVAALFRQPLRAHLRSESPLRLWRIVEETMLADGRSSLVLDPAVLAWLEGEDEIDRALAGKAYLLPSAIELDPWPLATVEQRLREGLQQGQRWRLVLLADDALAARWFAGSLGSRLGLPVLDVPARSLAGEPDAGVRLHRQAFLSRYIPCIAADDAQVSYPQGVLPYPIQIVHGTQPPEPEPDTRDLTIELAPPSPEMRERLWRHLWPRCRAWPREELSDLALCHESSISDIAAAAATAPENAAEAARALRDRLRNDLGSLARRSESAFRWDDLVLPEPVEARLKEFAFEARERAHVWANHEAARLFPYGRGLIGLFAGPPGTGKTMAAQVIAADLGRDLFTVDLSAVVSKWVGETAQHIQQLLSSRAAQRSVLFFDECDALFAKRVEEVRDAQDRYVNMDTSHLMTALEAYPGIVIMASNLKGNVDTAFLRRIRHIVDFAKPGAAAREQIWRRVVRTLFGPEPAQALEADLRRVARIEATGALIKSAALSALFASRRTGRGPDARLFGEMLARELAKDGSGVSPRALEALLEDPS